MDSRQRFLEIAHPGSLDRVPRFEEGIREEVSLEHDICYRRLQESVTGAP